MEDQAANAAAVAEANRIISDVSHPMHSAYSRGDESAAKHVDGLFNKKYPGETSIAQAASGQLEQQMENAITEHDAQAEDNAQAGADPVGREQAEQALIEHWGSRDQAQANVSAINTAMAQYATPHS
jgi:hypothetical protein